MGGSEYPNGGACAAIVRCHKRELRQHTAEATPGLCRRPFPSFLTGQYLPSHNAPKQAVLLAHRERRFREWEDREIDRDMDRPSWCWATERKRRPAKPVQPDAHSA